MLPLVLLLLTSWIQSRPIDGMPVTQLPTTPGCPPPNCTYQSKCYENGEEISRGHNGNNWCSGLVCIGGRIAVWDDFNCGSGGIIVPHLFIIPCTFFLTYSLFI